MSPRTSRVSASTAARRPSFSRRSLPSSSELTSSSPVSPGSRGQNTDHTNPLRQANAAIRTALTNIGMSLSARGEGRGGGWLLRGVWGPASGCAASAAPDHAVRNVGDRLPPRKGAATTSREHAPVVHSSSHQRPRWRHGTDLRSAHRRGGERVGPMLHERRRDLDGDARSPRPGPRRREVEAAEARRGHGPTDRPGAALPLRGGTCEP